MPAVVGRRALAIQSAQRRGSGNGVEVITAVRLVGDESELLKF